MFGSHDWTSRTNSVSYSYNYEGGFTGVKSNGQTIFQAVYDGDGRRVQTVVGDTTIYHYRLGSWDPAYTKDLTTGVQTDVVFAGALRIGKVQGGVGYYYHLDRLGSVRLVTRDQGTQTFTTKYQPYGSATSTSGTEAFQYTGKQFDIPTGLYYYGYRYYDPSVGRFITADNIQPDYSNPQSVNRYTYALGNPLRFTDPDGRVALIFEAGYRMTPKAAAGKQGKLAEAVSASNGDNNNPDKSKDPDPYDPHGPDDIIIKAGSNWKTMMRTGSPYTTGLDINLNLQGPTGSTKTPKLINWRNPIPPPKPAMTKQDVQAAGAVVMTLGGIAATVPGGQVPGAAIILLGLAITIIGIYMD